MIFSFSLRNRSAIASTCTFSALTRMVTRGELFAVAPFLLAAVFAAAGLAAVVLVRPADFAVADLAAVVAGGSLGRGLRGSSLGGRLGGSSLGGRLSRGALARRRSWPRPASQQHAWRQRASRRQTLQERACQRRAWRSCSSGRRGWLDSIRLYGPAASLLLCAICALAVLVTAPTSAFHDVARAERTARRRA